MQHKIAIQNHVDVFKQLLEAAKCLCSLSLAVSDPEHLDLKEEWFLAVYQQLPLGAKGRGLHRARRETVRQGSTSSWVTSNAKHRRTVFGRQKQVCAHEYWIRINHSVVFRKIYSNTLGAAAV